MHRTYEGTLNGNHIDWNGDAPTPERTLRVHVTVLDEGEAESDKIVPSQGSQMADALESLAKSGAFAKIDNPAQWQRDVREERLLPRRASE